MDTPAPKPEVDPPDSRRPQVRSRHLPSLLALLAVALTVLTFFVLQRRVQLLHLEIAQVLQPARSLVDEVENSFLDRSYNLRLYLLTGDRIFLDQYRAASVAQAAAMRRLRQFVPWLDPALVASYERIGDLVAEWGVDADRFAAGEITVVEFTDLLPARDAIYDQVRTETDVLARAVQAAIDQRRDRISSAETTQLLLAGLLALSALTAAMVLAAQRRRLRNLAGVLEKRREEVQRSMESRSRIMRGFSHDVKNPLGAADGALALLAEDVYGPLAAEQGEGVARARRSIRTALGLIDDLLTLAQAEAGQIEIKPSSTDVGEAVREIAEEYRDQAEAKGLELTIQLPESTLVTLSDATRIRQVVGNLLSNAVKYTERGGITVRVAVREDGLPPPRESRIAVEVADTGPGIAVEERDLLFQEFSRLDTGGAEGAGIGLAISRRVAHALGGEITVESEPGRGSVFTLWLPLMERDATESPPAADRREPGRQEKR